MRILTLTPIGEKLARNTHSPNTVTWRIIHFLDSAKQSTDETIKEKLGLSDKEYTVEMSKLRRAKPRVVAVVGGYDGL